MNELVRCSYSDLGRPVEIGNYQWRGERFRVTAEMIAEAQKDARDCLWEFKPYTYGSRVLFYEAVGPRVGV